MKGRQNSLQHWVQPSFPLVLDGGSAVRNEHSPPTNIVCTSYMYVCERECGCVGVYVSVYVCIHCIRMYMPNVSLHEKDFLCSPSLPNMELELSRAHIPRTGTSTIASTILHVVIFDNVCIAQFIDDPYLCWVWACAVEAAHGITRCDWKAWPIETRNL